MTHKKGFWAIFLIILLTGCNHIDNQIRIYFDPSGAVNIDRIPLSIKLDDQIILDTLIKNSHINKSLLLTHFKKSRNHKDLIVKINGKEKVIRQPSNVSSKCTDIFFGYDDHLLIFEEVKRIQVKMENQNRSLDFKLLFDSIKNSSGIKYHQITVNVREENCM